ncbi:MAG: MBL fold metallo-hydrolase [Candidatus Nanoarchaeia archaeon]|nr:MBL fold metallo-hydrolase [Candidatus Haiyanarchaeum thermophilum]MCW1302992.1 MBL fold metallo-hydrolase [Candidatus Haiyanarchaeum thermophilum]MCW1303670.1 MBL fold metallo-hydrolase [Candidatus Haiyanarchaeum thermophilum]MCW1306350.1 MBL fold metallo-hydrolase [Candidatus Haiyanarchaeum thermophilum]MCW1307140.1 MBL fold metallo-hydrolase [Candidatus Haiyanarchaeum thermophilum]
MRILKHIYLYRERSRIGDCNTYYLGGKYNILVDPGNPKFIQSKIEEMEREGVDIKQVRLVINTHAHPDHSAANNFIVKLSGAKIFVHPLELRSFEFNKIIARFLNIEFSDFKSSSETPKEEGIQILHTPGHTAGSISIYLPHSKTIITGDLIFRGAVGRTDLPGGSSSDLRNSLATISKLKIAYLLPGHGEIVSGEKEVQKNFKKVKELVKF